jgi:hypothetical protein
MKMNRDDLKQQFFLLLLELASQPITLEMIIQLGMMRAKVRSNYRAFRTHFDVYATPLMMVSLQNRIHTLSNEIKTLNAIIATQKDKSL